MSLLLCFKHVQASHNPILTEQQLIEILIHPDRFKQDAMRDPDRLPNKVMTFAGIAKGDKVLDLYAGGGWYSELFSMAVGPKGNVFAQNDHLTWRFGEKEITERTQNNRLPNLIRLDQTAIADIEIPNHSLDMAFMAMNYHDLFFTHRQRNGEMQVLRPEIVDYKTAFTVVQQALKPDGVLIIIDHTAQPGSGYSAANDLHRIDPNIVKHQLTDVGFVLLEEAFYLRNPKDDLNTLVFDPSIRGKTDRFIYKFGMPISDKNKTDQ